MDADEVFLFDLCGYIVVKGVLTPQEVAAANAAIDRNEESAVISGHAKGTAAVPDGKQRGDTSRWDLRGMLGWGAGDREPFQRMLAHPKLVRYVNTICGSGHRMDHAPTLITQTQGSPAGGLHGSSGPGFSERDGNRPARPAPRPTNARPSLARGLTRDRTFLLRCPPKLYDQTRAHITSGKMARCTTA
eukprot:SAG22_NODE_62_length_23371_cov_84.500602_18_plen_189_part_00